MSSVNLGMNVGPLGISERSRMNPTCGPLPWVMTTRQPSLTSPATSLAAARAFPNCSSMVPCSPSPIRALPPMAMTAARGKLGIQTQAPADTAQAAGETLERRARDAGSNLTHPRQTMGNAGVDHWRRAAVHNPAQINPGRRPRKAQTGQGILRVATQRDAGHFFGIADGVGGIPADEAHDRWRCGHGKAADSGSLRNRAVAKVRIGVIRTEPGEI